MCFASLILILECLLSFVLHSSPQLPIHHSSKQHLILYHPSLFLLCHLFTQKSLVKLLTVSLHPFFHQHVLCVLSFPSCPSSSVVGQMSKELEVLEWSFLITDLCLLNGTMKRVEKSKEWASYTRQICINEWETTGEKTCSSTGCIKFKKRNVHNRERKK